ncbi:MAG TPA: hypothetical protein K8W01_06645 [Methylorubrum populi]|uniref:Flagellar biosynthesis protein FliO n=1 Tax=Methylorubrum populi TaxID=223967 RepID=A0A921E1H7_9HYPH|nr:hypothetical protein [Methylorubrum populi]
MQAFFSSEGSYALQFLVIFLVILVLFLVATMLFMRLSGRRLSLAAGSSQRGRQPRLGIVDIYELDRQRQLILLRRDNVEHLLLVGGPNDVVIERHIQRGAGSRYAPEAGTRPEAEIGSPDALEPPRTEPFLDSPAPPTFTMPEVVPPAKPGAALVPDRAPPLDPGLFEPEERAPVPRPASPVGRLMRRTAPSLVTPRPEVASERVARAEAVAAPTVPTSPPESEPVPEPPPVIVSREPRVVDPAVLSDMARQLQVALKRPSSAVTPPPVASADVPPRRPAPEPAAPTAPAQPDPVAVAMSAAQPSPVVPPGPAPEAKPVTGAGPDPSTLLAEAANPARGEPKVRTSSKPVPPPLAPEPQPAPSPKPELSPLDPPKSDVSASDAPKPDPAEPAPQGQNPFSVEEIEAEFARLLGRPLDNRG